MPTLVVDGKLTVPLYHGTSTLFQGSILETGLGGRKIVEDLGLRATAQEILKYEEELATLPNWPFEKRFLLKLAEDPASQNPALPTVFNFRYGGTYVTPSAQTAARYALLNNCGSEALAGTLKVLDALLGHLPNLAVDEQFSRVRAFGNTPKTPIVVEARDVPVASLRPEQGGQCDRVLEFIESSLGDVEFFDTIVQQSNFELLLPIPAAQLRFYKIVSPQSGYDSFESLQLDPL